ncbi:MAG: EAL domain-containing protein, partial [Desulfuromonadales bacterium]
VTLGNDLRRALEGNEFVLCYQPQVELESGRIVGAEVLLRWRHPLWGMITPASFISFTEETGLIIPIGFWVLRQTCLQARQWQKQGMPELRLALNLSPRQILHQDLPDAVREILQETGLNPALLELEFTEEAVRNHEEAVPVLRKLGGLGIGIALDNFGTGLSSIPVLSRIPLGRMKIDISLIRRLPADPENAEAVRLIISIAHALGVPVLAEGVESEEQRAFLLENGCNQGQGFLFGEPATAESFKTIRKNRSGGN